MSIHAELEMADGRVLTMTDVLVPCAASAGKVTVHVTYPATERGGAVSRVVLHAGGETFQGEFRPLIFLGPGDTLSVEVSA